MTALRFSALDTWFFRESRPMGAVGGSELASVFPPPPRTLLGAVRTAIGDAAGVDWQRFRVEPEHPLHGQIGSDDSLGPLALSGPWLSQDGERLYPAPLFLLARREEFARLRIGQAVDTHLGRVRLPELSKDKQGYKPLEQSWLTRAGLACVLDGGVPPPQAVRIAADLFREEPRLGIARDNARRIADEGLLYQTRHLRPRSGLAIEADITLSQGTMPPSGLVRLGGEGRMAYLDVHELSPFPEAPTPTGDTRGIILVLLTTARGEGRHAWLLPGFTEEERYGHRVWQGRIAGTAITLHAAVLGKAQREGGWDMANHRPRAMQSLIPAGSAYYVTVEGDIEAAIRNLHGTRIGEDQPLGRGLLACGLWNSQEF